MNQVDSTHSEPGEPRRPGTGIREAGRGVRWRLVGNSAEKLVNLAALPILMRLVDRSGWGLFYYAMVISALVTMLRDLGIPQAIIRSPNVTQRFLSTCFWVRLAVGLLLYVVLVSVAIPISFRFGGTAFLSIVAVMGTTLVWDAFPSIQQAILIRELRIQQTMQVRVVAVVAGVFCSVILAISGFHEWALVAGSVLTTIASGVLYLFATSWRPTFELDREELRPVVRFGLNISGTQALSWFTEYFAGFALGLSGVGEQILGYFSRAFIFAKYPDSLLGNVVGGGLATSLFAKVQHEPARMREALRRATGVMYLVGLPLSVVLIVLTEDFISVVAGPRWGASVLPCRIIAIGGTCLMMRQTLRHWLIAADHPAILLRNQTVVAVVSILATLIGVWYGMTGVAIATTIACFVEFVLLWFMSRSLTQVGLQEWLVQYWRPIASAVVMAIALVLTRWILPQTADLTLRVLTEAFVGTSVWLAMAWLLCANDLYVIAQMAIPGGTSKPAFVSPPQQDD